MQSIDDNIRVAVNKALAEEFGENQVRMVAARRGSGWRYALEFTDKDASLETIRLAAAIVDEFVIVDWQYDKAYVRD